MKKMVILDRDGVINYDSKDYIKTPAEWQPLPGSLRAIAILKEKGFLVTLATNQSGLGRGYFDLPTLDAIHQKLLTKVMAAGGKIDEIAYCPHAPDDNCGCRKPKPGLVLKLLTNFNIDPNRDLVYFIGDSLRDLGAALATSCTPVLVKTGNGEKTLAKLKEDKDHSTLSTATAVYTNLLEFAESL